MRKRLLNLVLLISALSATTLYGADMFSGMWKMNIAKSTFSPGPPPTAATVQKIESVDNGITFVGATGFTVKFDGKDIPYKAIIDGKPDPNGVDTVSARKVGDYEFEITFKSKGKVLSVRKNVISKDGRTRTITMTGTNAQGKPVHNTVVFEKQ